MNEDEKKEQLKKEISIILNFGSKKLFMTNIYFPIFVLICHKMLPKVEISLKFIL